jgi:hypothetical protein
LAGEKAAANWRIGYDCYAELATGAQDFIVLNIETEGIVFDLVGGDRMDGVGATNCSDGNF